MASLFNGGRFQGFDASGNPLSGGLLYSYSAGTLSALPTYTTQAGDVANANPVVLDSAGRAAVWLGSSSYRMILKTSAGVTVWDTDNISGQVESGDLSDTDTATSGAGMVGVRRGVDYPFDTAGFLLVRNGDPVNVFQAFTSKAEVEATRAHTSTTDHTAILQDVFANDRHVYLPYGRFNTSSELAMGSHAVSIEGQKGTLIRATDGAYDLLSYTGAQRFFIRNVRFYGTNTLTPTLRLLRLDTSSAYFDVTGCEFAYGDVGLSMDGCYISKSIGNNFSNCDTFFEWGTATASVADLVSMGDTFGSSSIGTDALVKISASGCVMSQAYFETGSHTKAAIHALTGAQNLMIEASLYSSGEVIFETSTGGTARLLTKDSYSTSNNRFLRVAGGAGLNINGSKLQQTTLLPGIFAVSASGSLVAHGVELYKWDTGISSSDVLSLHGGVFSGNGTAISASGTGSIVDPAFATNTTDFVAGASIAVNVTAKGSATFNPASLADGAGETTTVTVTGAALGDFAEASFSLNLQGITLTAWVSAADTVSVRFQNETGGLLDLGSGTLRAVVRKV